MKYILQVFTGFGSTCNVPAEDLMTGLDSVTSRLEVDSIIIGWCTDSSLYKRIGAFLHRRGIKMFLWLPAFSEVSEAFKPDQTLDVFGKPVPVPLQQDGETFHFVCPSSRHNAQTVFNRYEKYFAGCGFDGVFLDRIRSQSFVGGVPGVLSCACGRCRAAFHAKKAEIDVIRELYADRKDAFFDMRFWPANGQFVLENAAAQRFFEAKEEIIADAVTEIARYFRNKGLLVGLDLFAPVLSRFVGQNYALIAKNADFIKPMLYRRTEAPAGIGYEYALFEKHVPEARGRIRISMDEAFLHTQLQALKNLPCEMVPGIEINFDEKLVRTDPAYIAESLRAIKSHGFEKAALCWNVLQAPKSHLEAIQHL